MKKTGKVFGKILAIALSFCVLLGAFPVIEAHAATLREIRFDYDSRFGLVREEKNSSFGKVGARVNIYIFPNDGCLTDTFTITDNSGNEIEKTFYGNFEGGEMYYITMPNSDITVTADFKPDNANGYYRVTCNYVGEGSVTFYKNGLRSSLNYAHAGDRLQFVDPVAGEGYIYNSSNNNDSCTTPNGSRYLIRQGTAFYMPECEITINIYFDKAYDINIVASGGTAASYSYLSTTNVITEASEDTSVSIFPVPDENHIGSAKYRIVSDSGEEIIYHVEKYGDKEYARFYMPAEPVTVYVTLLKDNYDVVCSAENGTIGYTASDGTGYGRPVEIDAAPYEGYGLKELYYTYTPEVGLDAVRREINPKYPVFGMPQADVSVNAVFAAICRAQWLDGDGSVLDSNTYLDGDPIPETDKIPTKESTWECDYEFVGWSAPTYYTGGLVVFRPVFDKIYTVNISGGTAQPAKAKAGTTVTLTPDDAPNDMYCSGWRVVSGDVEVNGNSFVMPENHVALYATYALKKEVDIDFTLSAAKGYVGKPFTVSGTVNEGSEILNIGGTMTITFSAGAPEAEGAAVYTVPVENGRFALDVPALTAETDYIWLEYSGYAEYATALVSDTLRVYSISSAGLDGLYGENSTKIYYNAGEALNTENLLIWVFWMDGTFEEIPVTPNMVSGFNSTRFGRQTLTVACPYQTNSDLTYEIVVRGVFLGDANGDGKVDVRDVTAIQRHSAELEPLTGDSLTAADTNGDGVVNINDATHLQMYLAEFNGIVLGEQPTT